LAVLLIALAAGFNSAYDFEFELLAEFKFFLILPAVTISDRCCSLGNVLEIDLSV